MRQISLLLLLCCLFYTCGTNESNENAESANISVVKVAEATGLNGTPLYQIEESSTSRKKQDSLLAIARANYDRAPNNLENIIWLGRRTAYLTKYREAITIYTEGIKQFPDAPELYRHRGHRYISVRMLDKAIADFEKAAELVKDRQLEIEPDGIPNSINQPLSNLQFNIYYHWALAHYLKGNFEEAAGLYEICMNYSDNTDLVVATSDWLYMTYQRLGAKDKAMALLAGITPDMEIIENATYHQRLLLYKGLIEPKALLDLDNTDEARQLDIVTSGYGVGNWYWSQGDSITAKKIFEKIVTTNYWPAFGYIAAEAELSRL